MDKGREVFRQADVFLKIAAENGVVPEAQEHKEVRYMRLRLKSERYIFFSLVNGVLTCFYTKVMELGGLLVQITHVQVTFSCTLKYPFLIR